ncbi:MAG: four helix bundle protein, partial [Candidatus Zambryskibacteria bacterium]|nr:four helix bundle protein [Candidatus Zambryskibacteria bacterium]
MEQNSKIKDFTDLETWRKAHELAIAIYKITEKFPKSEAFGLVSQIQRAAVSITSNIAEGFGRQTIKEKIQFYYQAQGSLTEVKNQLILSKDLDYISATEFDKI